MTADELYLATSRSWKLSMERCQRVSTVLCVAENEVKEVYSVDEWIESIDEGRKEFVGKIAQEPLRSTWLGQDASSISATQSDSVHTRINWTDVGTFATQASAAAEA